MSLESLFGRSSSENAIEIKDTGESVIEMLISDYISQPHNYTVKVVFSHDKFRFKHFKTTICPQESIIFIVGQMEIIANKLYVYANDINFINTHFITKKKELSDTELPSTNPIPNPTRYKLLNVYQTITQNSEVDSENNLLSLKCKRSNENVKPENTNPTTDNDIEDCQSNSDNSIHTDQKSETNNATKDCNKNNIHLTRIIRSYKKTTVISDEE
ncbi:449_t:CDS:1 [Dentiscutata erythropus]|uniref:449_t:CDS:1 n=1 Tax=Dentiscutata erythropus TaxID=1348616 RepID=A0A9N9KBH2_9GLOM|nr:449_t:CDS:1 [Dentiscutata erythropus]